MPVCVALGMIGLSTSFGIHTAMQQLRRGPNVHVKKTRRETLPEIVEPENVAEEAEKFVNKSLFRKVAHIQDIDSRRVIPDPRGNIYTKLVLLISIIKLSIVLFINIIYLLVAICVAGNRVWRR